MPDENELNAAEEAAAYMRRYKDTTRALLRQREHFRDHAENSPIPGERELARAMALEAHRAYELLTSRHDVYTRGDSPVRRPTLKEIEAAQVLAQRLAALAAEQARAEAIFELVNNAVEELNKVSDAS